MSLKRPLLQYLRQSAVGVAISLAISGVMAQPLDESVRTRYPAGSISSLEQADRALAEASAERNAVERRFAAEQGNCYTKFFATSCMDESRERRRKALADVRTVEIEANEFKRRERAAERDREVAQRIADSEAKRIEREKQLQQQQQAQPADAGLVEKKDTGTVSPATQQHPSGPSQAERAARHEAKLRRIQAEEAANAAKRAENVEAYERKQREAEEHQKEVENRKAEKERERARKAASSPSSSAQ
jgi:hypothetical protein